MSFPSRWSLFLSLSLLISAFVSATTVFAKVNRSPQGQPIYLPGWVLFLISPEVSLPIGMAFGGGVMWLLRRSFEAQQELSRVRFKEDIIQSIDNKLDEQLSPRILEVEELNSEQQQALSSIKERHIELLIKVNVLEEDVEALCLSHEEFLRQVDKELGRVLSTVLGTQWECDFYKNSKYSNPRYRGKSKGDDD